VGRRQFVCSNKSLAKSVRRAWHNFCCDFAATSERLYECQRIFNDIYSRQRLFSSYSLPGYFVGPRQARFRSEGRKAIVVTLNNIKRARQREKSPLLALIATLLLIGVSGCEFIGDVFQAGVGVGVVLVLGVIALIVWMIARPKT